VAKHDQEAGRVPCKTKFTFVDLIEFADDIQAYFRELVFKKVEEKRKKVFDSELFTKQWREATDLGGKSRPDVLRSILAQVSNAWHDTEENHLFLEHF
jgi:hypothetical protein